MKLVPASRPMSKRCREFIRNADAAMQQQPVGLPLSEVKATFEMYLNANYTPEPDEFRAELVRRWLRFSQAYSLFSESEAA